MGVSRRFREYAILIKTLTTARLALPPVFLWFIGASVGIAQEKLTVHQSGSATLSDVAAASIALSENSSRHDFGKVSLLDQPEIAHLFAFRNNSDHLLVLAHLQPSCSCTDAVVTIGNATAYSRQGAENVQTLPSIAPDQQFFVCVSVNTAHLAPGPIFKSVAIFVRGNTHPAFTLEMTGTLLPVVAFTPAFIDFGKATSAQVHPQRLTVSLDARLAPGGHWPVLTSSNPDVQITPLPTEKPRSPQTSRHTLLARSYQLTLSPRASLGPLSGRLSFAPTASDSAPHPVPGVDLQAPLTEPSALLLGEVTGDVSASPSSLAFGNTQPGAAVTRSVLLTGSPVELSALKVASDSPWLMPRLKVDTHVFPGGARASAVRELDITLSPDVPVGTLRSNVTVTLSNGQRLLIPASAYIASGQ
jgi:hypothetical protein